MAIKFRAKLRHAARYDHNAVKGFNSKLESQGKHIRLINLVINIAYKINQKLKEIQKKPPKLDKSAEGVVFFADHLNIQNMAVFQNRILIVAELSIPQCTKYRVTQKYDMLKLFGFNVKVISWADTEAVEQAIQLAGTIIFYRVPAFNNVIKYYDIAKYLGITTYFDVDDLIFDEELLKENLSLKKLSPQELEGIFNGAKLYKNSMLMADYGIASTKELAKQMQLIMNKPVFVLNNAIDELSINASNKTIENVSDRIRIVYGSGTKTHDMDFMACAKALNRILRKYKNVDFIIYGHLQLDDSFDDLKDQIFRVPFVDADIYYPAIGTYDIAIAPLEKNTFNDCKSNIKFIESAMLKIPCICSKRAEFVAAVRNGENGFLADNENEWFNAFESLITSEDLRTKIAEQAYLDTLNFYHWEKIANSQLNFLTLVPKTNKKRLLIVNILFKPDSFGGATIIADNTAQFLNKSEDFEVMVFCGTFDKDMYPYQTMRYEIDGIPVLKVKIHSINAESNYNNPEIKKVFSGVLESWQPDIVHFHSIQEIGASLAESCLSQNIPYLVTLHDAWWFCERQFMVNNKNKFCNNTSGDLAICAKCIPDPAFNHKRRFYLKNILDNASILLTPSIFQKNLYKSVGVNEYNIVVNKNGIEVVKTLYKKDFNAEDPIKFAYLGGKAIHKGYFWLCDIFSEIDKNNYILKIVNIESRFNAAGGTPENFNKNIRNNIEITPYFNQDKIDEFFADVDVLLFPSLWKESFGLTVREAMIRDVWVITTDCGGPAEDVIDGVNGTIVPFEDKDAFKLAILNVLNNPEKIKKYINPLKDQIRLINDQVSELAEIYSKFI